MKTTEDLNKLKAEYDKLMSVLGELSEEELKQVTGGEGWGPKALYTCPFCHDENMILDHSDGFKKVDYFFCCTENKQRRHFWDGDTWVDGWY